MEDHTMELDLEPEGSLSIECVVDGPIETNTYFVMSEGEAVIIDPGWEGEKLVQGFKERHPDLAVTAIISTHAHADHTGGVAGARRQLGPGVPYLISAVDAPMVESDVVRMRDKWGFDYESPGEPTRLLEEGDTVPVGPVRLQVFLVPGHTPGGIVLFAAAREGPVAFVGDTLFPGSHGRTDLPGGSEEAIMRSLAKMARLLPKETLCLTGHNESTTMARELRGNPYVVEACRRYR